MITFDYAQGDSATTIPAQLSADVRPYAGGTDLLTRIKLDITTPNKLVDVKSAALPTGISESEDGIIIGALTTLTEIATSNLLAEKCTLLCEAAATAATPQIRNRATIGGNLLQRPRCWYYRNQHVDCWLKGGDDCPAQEGQNQLHAIFDDSPCCAVHPSDLAGCLLALDASVTLRNPEGERTLPLADFFASPTADRRRETVIKNDELLLSISIPALPAGTRSTYLKAMDRKVWAFALVGVAAVLRVEQDEIRDVRLVLNGVANIPYRLAETETALLYENGTRAQLTEVAGKALTDAQPLANNRYKVPLARRLLLRALIDLTA